MYLCLASTDRTHFDVILFDETSITENKNIEAPNLLTAVDTILQEQNITKESIQGIFVVVGTGSFSGVRGGTVLANTWSLVKKIPVMAITPEQVAHLQELIPQLHSKEGYALPTYTGEPNIRLKKSDP